MNPQNKPKLLDLANFKVILIFCDHLLQHLYYVNVRQRKTIQNFPYFRGGNAVTTVIVFVGIFKLNPGICRDKEYHGIGQIAHGRPIQMTVFKPDGQGSSFSGFRGDLQPSSGLFGCLPEQRHAQTHLSCGS